ncbi:acyl-CoA dehydrogenase family protein [Saccharopolyspora sp. ASAGF58]|uniref:acyl-CoA dehydrogenase family protein n=1 Tax=Saccharopolyspora sp. ASAGF58 TaxID=2719023 RepID=UPI00143FFDC2|nr:acyl-CoA dehydrogenase family protein [Saccharopolyspora sp. ASAGF58]QIZ37734.1 acyl-CoA dehydrogenase [Saccharopolyspora sp. ASAGF58]
MTTTPSEVGTLGAEAIRDVLRRATSGSPIATYAEGESPVSWNVLASGGWDLIGHPENGASVRDLAEVARAWGYGCVPLPLIPTLVAKRHSAAAAGHDGPVTLALPLSGTTRYYVPFGQVAGIRLATGLGAGADELADVPGGESDTLALTMLGIESDARTALTDTVAREIAILLAAEAAGGAERLLFDSTAFVTERKQFGRPVGAFQAVKHHLADAAIAAELAETAVIWAAERPGEAFRGALFAIDRGIDIAELAVQVHGGLGFTWEMGLHFPLRQMMMARELVSALEEVHG